MFVIVDHSFAILSNFMFVFVRTPTLEAIIIQTGLERGLVEQHLHLRLLPLRRRLREIHGIRYMFLGPRVTCECHAPGARTTLIFELFVAIVLMGLVLSRALGIGAARWALSGSPACGFVVPAGRIHSLSAIMMMMSNCDRVH